MKDIVKKVYQKMLPLILASAFLLSVGASLVLIGLGTLQFIEIMANVIKEVSTKTLLFSIFHFLFLIFILSFTFYIGVITYDHITTNR